MKTLILDCNNLLYRTFWISKNKGLVNSKSQNIGSVLYFLNCVRAYVKTYQPDRVYAAWDKKLTWPSTNFRKELVATKYKGNRNYSSFEGVHEHDDLIQQMLSNLNIKNIFPNVLEADDVIAWLTHTLEGSKVVVSTDKDLWQLVNEDTIVFEPTRKKEITIFNFEESSGGVKRENFLLYKCILGDVSDNVEGVQGYGKIKAKRCAENNLESLNEEQKAVVEMNLKISDLSYGYKQYDEEETSYKNQLELLKGDNYDLESFKDIIEHLELTSISKSFNNWLSVFDPKKNINKCIEDLRKRLNI